MHSPMPKRITKTALLILIALGVCAKLPAAAPAAGTVAAWGDNSAGQTNVLMGLTNVVSIAASGLHSLALRDVGTVVTWGYAIGGTVATPPSGLSGVTAVSAGGAHVLALKSDGTVVVWGDNRQKQLEMPANLSGIKAISAGSAFSLALRNDGTVVAWGDNTYNQTKLP